MGYVTSSSSYVSNGVSALGCPPLKKLACASAVALCLATPAPVQCILAVAPNCLDCL